MALRAQGAAGAAGPRWRRVGRGLDLPACVELDTPRLGRCGTMALRPSTASLRLGSAALFTGGGAGAHEARPSAELAPRGHTRQYYIYARFVRSAATKFLIKFAALVASVQGSDKRAFALSSDGKVFRKNFPSGSCVGRAPAAGLHRRVAAEGIITYVPTAWKQESAKQQQAGDAAPGKDAQSTERMNPSRFSR